MIDAYKKQVKLLLDALAEIAKELCFVMHGGAAINLIVRDLLNYNSLEPNWSVHDFQKFPSVKWKLINLGKFRAENPKNYKQQLIRLEQILAP